jgi:glycosyltransferase involved in cell wall biosynthesis
MRVAIAAVHVPFINGGATIMRDGLARSLKDRGVKVDCISRPFRFRPAKEILRSMDEWEASDADAFDCGVIDRAICINFPSFYLKHHHKLVWLMHQHRAVYELYGTPYGADSTLRESGRLKRVIHRRDTASLQEAKHVYTISRRVSDRLRQFNAIHSVPLYQPPTHPEHYYCSEQLPYIFAPSRLESLKRQELLIRAMRHVRGSVAVVIAGEGGQRENLERLAIELGVESKVRFLGHVSREEMIAWYANALAVFFGPYDEDYGFVTLEAMLASKPVLTCADSGGPLEFVSDRETGFVCEPDPDEIASRIDWLCANPRAACDLGRSAKAHYESLHISWANVVDHLLA